MLNPAELYSLETDAELNRPGPMVVLLGAFIDAGSIQRVLDAHLSDAADLEVIASFDVDQLLDYRGRRPAMTFDQNRWSTYEDPAMVLHRLTDRDGQIYYLLTGPEPDYQWERCVEAVRQLIRCCGITLVVSTHGIPMGVPHTRPVGVTAHATDPQLVGEAISPWGQVQVPSSFPALLELRLGEAGHNALGFAIHVPQYLAGAEWAEGALAALNSITDATGLNLPNDALIARVAANNREIAGELTDNDEAGQLISALERQYDSFVEGQERPSLLSTGTEHLPSADELGADIEQFLRNVSED